MGRLATTDARYQFAELLNRVCYGRERIVLERRGKELAALVPIEDLRALEALERHLDVKKALATLVEGKSTVLVDYEEIRSAPLEAEESPKRGASRPKK